MSSGFRFSTGSLARACARRPVLTIAAWLLISAFSIFAITRLLDDAITTEMKFTRAPESEQGRRLLAERLRGPEKINEVVIVSSPESTVDDPVFKQQVDLLGLDLINLGRDVVEGGTYYYQARDESLVSADRHTTILPLIMAGTLADAEKNIGQVRDAAARAAERSGFEVLTTGAASSGEDFNELSQNDLRKAELYGIPTAMVILLIVFGSFVLTYMWKLKKRQGSLISTRRVVLVVALGSLAASLLPLMLAMFSIVIATGATAVVGQRFIMSFFVVNMITMMGLAVGIDYSLFVASRYLEELIGGRDRMQAIEIAGSTASRAVLFSGMTVILALAGMLIIPMSLFYSLAVGAILVVAVSVLAALTLLPAILKLVGKPLSAQAELAPRAAGQNAADEEIGGRFWHWITGTVMARPVVSVMLATTVLAVPALYYFQIDTGANGIDVLPDSYQSKQGFQIMDREFSFGLISPAEIVIDGDVNSRPVREALTRLQEEMKQDDGFYGAPRFEANQSGDLGLLSAALTGTPDSDRSTGAVKRLREEYIPRAFEGVDATVLVSGPPAMNLDYFNMTDDYRPIVFAFVLGLSFVLLTLVFRSLVVPLKALIMNLLSVGAAYGMIVLVFQDGVGAGLFGFSQVRVVEAWVPLFLFSVLFGLSMDYHVFLLGRIRENYSLTGDNSRSVALGLMSTGKIITGAALIMVVVFSGFASGQLVMFQQMGFGLAVAVLLDATVVRSVLVPATMKLLGDWNWYLPRWLEWLPDFHIEGVRAADADDAANQPRDESRHD